MSYLHIIILAIVEGITEFLPVSSTFHLIQTGRFLGLPQSDILKLFEVFIQAGAVASLFFLFSKQVWTDQKRYQKIIVSTIPVLMGGFLLHSYIKGLFDSPYATTLAFMAMGVVFILVELWVHRPHNVPTRSLAYMTMSHAVIIGIAQMVALIPGVSRSGVVMVTLLLLGYHRTDAAIYALALSVPAIFAAAGYDLLKYVQQYSTIDLTVQLHVLLVGFIVSFITAYFAAGWLLRFFQHRTLRLFGVYRLIVGALLLVLTYYGSRYI